MDTTDVSLRLPAHLYEQLQALAAEEQTEPREVIARLVAQARQSRRAEVEGDPIFGIFGAYTDQNPLIDGIPVSEDPDLYVVAVKMGERASGQHAWEVTPARYERGADGRPMRRQLNELDEKGE